MSVRARTTLVAAAATAAILVGASVLLVEALEASLTHASDRVSRARLDELAEQTEGGDLPARLPDAGNGFTQVVSALGRVLAASPNIAGHGAITDLHPPRGGLAATVVHGAPDDTETEDYRVWASRVGTGHGEATVYVGSSLESVSDASATLRHALWVGVPATLALLVVAIWLLVGRALRPVESIRAEVAAITGAGLDRRVPEPPTQDEVGRLARTMNDMLARLERGRQRERQFVADASHELLSPLAATRTMLEVGVTDPSQDWDALARDLLAENAGMEHTVRDLLFLARDDEGHPTGHPALDLDDVVLEEASRLRTLTAVVVDTSEVSAGPVRGDREELRRLVRNLLENAARHARTEVRVRLRAGESAVRLHVTDDGPGIDPDVGDQVFERFYQADPARARSSKGAGLGLAIARAVATRHSGTLELGPPEPGAHLVLTLPMDTAGTADEAVDGRRPPAG